MARKIITVKTSTELKDAIEALAAGGGGTIRLEASSRPYDVILNDRFRSQTDAPITITSADPKNPASIASMRLVDRENLTFDKVVFDSSALGGSRLRNHRDLEITNSKNITVTNSEFRGDATESLDGTPGQARGFMGVLVRDSKGVVLTDNAMSGYYHGISFKDSNNAVFSGNEMTKLQGDAIRIAGMQDMMVEGNHLHGMLGALSSINHSDMIQFFGTHITQNTERVTIRDNIINTSDGPAYQMIFGGNEDKAQNGWLFKDIVIEGNLLYGAHHNMISLGTTRDMVVRNNTVLWNQDTHHLLDGGKLGSSDNGWIRARDSVGTKIEGNLAGNIRGGTGPNAIINYTDPASPDHFSRNFVNLDAGGTAELQDLSLLPGSQWNGKLGAPMTWSSYRPEEMTAAVRVARDPGDRSLVTLDASLSKDAGGAKLGAGASYLWTFSDGARKQGQTVTHDFKTPGAHSYTLEVRANGRSDTIERKIEIQDPGLLKLAIGGGKVQDASSYDSSITLDGGRTEGGAFVLDGKSKIAISRYADQIYSLDQFKIAMTFAPEKAGAGGVLFMLRGSMEAVIRSDGGVRFTLETTEGKAVVETSAGAFSGTQARDLAVIYDGRTVSVAVDGATIGSASVTGITKPAEWYGLVIGNQWNSSVKGKVSDISIASEIGAKPPLVAGDRDEGTTAPEPPVVAKPEPKPEPEPEPESSDGGPDTGGAKPAPGAPSTAKTLVALDFEGNLAEAMGRAIDVKASGGPVRYMEGAEGQGVAIGGGSVLTINRNNAFLHERDSFAIAFDLQRDAGSDGRVLQLYKALEASVGRNGAFIFKLETDEGTFRARTEAGAISEGDWHRVEIGYDDAAERLRVSVDGEAVETRASGTTAEGQWWGLTLGSNWGNALDGVIDSFRMSDAPDWA